MDVPGPRTGPEREVGTPIPLAGLLPGPVHYVLAGGGSHGAVQWGALQALDQTDLAPDAVIGTSAGALTGVVLSEDYASGIHRLAYVWAQMDRSHVVGEKWLRHSITQARAPGLMSNRGEVATLESLLRATLFEDLDLPFAAVATDLASGRVQVFDEGPLIPALLASSAIPGVLRPIEIDGRFYCDGLVSANLPAVPAVERGAGSIVVLDTGMRRGEVVTSPTRVLARVGAIMAASQRRRQLRGAAQHVPVLLLPTPQAQVGAMEFAHTMQAGGQAYAMTRAFVADLVRQFAGRTLEPGLYARPDDRAVSIDLMPLLRAVPS